ncbi:MAG: PhzF family phenazine biosynthesis protein [Gemmatimonadales bacterium]|nr:PhzF family phenazine biosynthesis protein [Gemmatimonadales bacterium]MYG48620.1 PhzF family phenazine biosynthesis protein [Gemmatimonadales bacterium]MYK01724.1 PhzF family phenazine biosynthesis protein [Candidatus Palauibacter ramosifaciens]
MKIPLYQLDAFSDRPFEGNPAAVCPLEAWLDDDVLQKIAAENNLSETAFFVYDGASEGDGFGLRWFTPVSEVDLCGHATLASAWVIFERLAPGRESVRFETRSGELIVERGEEDLLVMDFPARPAVSREAPRALVEGLGAEPAEALASDRDYLVILEAEDDVRKLKPDFARLRGLDRLGIIVSAPGVSADFVSRFFAPSVGVPEDPVTGSAHCTLAPYWAERLGRGGAPLEARQISARGGTLICRHLGDRVTIAGRAALYLAGEITL